MPRTWECPDCKAVYGGPLVVCPRCAAFTSPTPEDDMPKITVHGGPTNFSADWSDDGPDPAEGSAPSPGTSSPASLPTPSDRTSSSAPSDPPPAPTTEPPSSPDPEESSTALPTDGSTPATGDPDKPPADPGYDARTVIELRGLLKDRGLSTAGSKAELVQRLSDADGTLAWVGEPGPELDLGGSA